jgi:hypothetical protein
MQISYLAERIPRFGGVVNYSLCYEFLLQYKRWIECIIFGLPGAWNTSKNTKKKIVACSVRRWGYLIALIT